LARALAMGGVGFEAACLVARVMATCGRVPWEPGEQDGEGAEAAWIDRAERRTFKHLRQEVWAVGLLARVEG